MLAYLRQRGFPEPGRLATQYELVYAPHGYWVKRVLFPLRGPDRSLLGWTGRAIRDDIQPRYLTTKGVSTLYLPRVPRERLIVVEGAFDALKVAAACETRPLGAVALNGLLVTSGKKLMLRQLRDTVRIVQLSLDATAALTNWLGLLRELSSIFPRVERLDLPEGHKDPGGMPISAIVEWLT